MAGKAESRASVDEGGRGRKRLLRAWLCPRGTRKRRKVHEVEFRCILGPGIQWCKKNRWFPYSFTLWGGGVPPLSRSFHSNFSNFLLPLVRSQNTTPRFFHFAKKCCVTGVNHQTIIFAKMSFFKNLFKEVFASLSHSATKPTSDPMSSCAGFATRRT